MGQYYLTVNLDKKQYLHPHKLGDGLKLMEFAQGGGTMTGLALLLSNGNGRGGGDWRGKDDPDNLIGSWAGDRIVIAGDYGDEGKFIEDLDAAHAAIVDKVGAENAGAMGSLTLYDLASHLFEDISLKVRKLLAQDPGDLDPRWDRP